jgi:hypothetical protein
VCRGKFRPRAELSGDWLTNFQRREAAAAARQEIGMKLMRGSGG